jgi:hypothetical protein
MWKEVDADREIDGLKVIGNRVREKHNLPPMDSE